MESFELNFWIKIPHFIDNFFDAGVILSFEDSFQSIENFFQGYSVSVDYATFAIVAFLADLLPLIKF